MALPQMHSHRQNGVAESDPPSPGLGKTKGRRSEKAALATKRRCVSTACIACRRRKSKCDGNTPSCAACASVYGTDCVYDPNSDHRRKGVYKKDIDTLKTRNSTLQTLIQAILNYPERDVPELVRKIRTCENLEAVAEEIHNSGSKGETDTESEEDVTSTSEGLQFERELSGRMGELRLENGSIRFLGGTSNLLFNEPDTESHDRTVLEASDNVAPRKEDAIKSWTNVTDDPRLILHLLNLYFTWHYTYFTTLSKRLFLRDFKKGYRPTTPQPEYCAPVLVNAMLALGCHFTSWPAARSDPNDSSTVGDHFFKEAKRLVFDNDEFETPRLATVQALALMSVREAGCGREVRGWVYSGMSFRMAFDLGLNIETKGASTLDEQETDARRITFWGCFLFDKCWSNYLGRLPQLPMSTITTPRFDVFPDEDSEMWAPWTDTGPDQTHRQPSRTRAVAMQISKLCEISSDLMLHFYQPITEKPLSKQVEVKKLSGFHTRLEAWQKSLPKELEPKEGQLPSVLVMYMFYNLLFIHLFRPFLKYNPANTPLPPHVSPRKMCTQAAARISKLLRLYNRTYGLRQVCNIVVYIAHAATTIHILNLPNRDAARDILHGVRQLDDIAQAWPCARRTLATLARQVRKWDIQLPDDAATALARAVARYGEDTTGASPPPAANGPVAPPPPDPDATSGPHSISPTLQQAHRLVHSDSRQPRRPEGPASTAMPSSDNDPALLNSTLPSLVGDAGPPVASSTVPVIGGVVPQAPQPFAAAQTAPAPWTFAASGGSENAEPPMGIASDTGPSMLPGPAPLSAQHSALFTPLTALFEQGRDWWYRDQSQIYNSWPDLTSEDRRDSASTGTSGGVVGNGSGETGFVDFSNDLDMVPGQIPTDFNGNAGMY